MSTMDNNDRCLLPAVEFLMPVRIFCQVHFRFPKLSRTRGKITWSHGNKKLSVSGLLSRLWSDLIPYIYTSMYIHYLQSKCMNERYWDHMIDQSPVEKLCHSSMILSLRSSSFDGESLRLLWLLLSFSLLLLVFSRSSISFCVLYAPEK